MTIDKQSLLKIAESVDREEWAVLDNGDDEYQVIVSGSLERGATYRSYRPVANEIPEQEIAAFIAAFNPSTLLALLDENIQLQREKDAIEAVALALRDDIRQARTLITRIPERCDCCYSEGEAAIFDGVVAEFREKLELACAIAGIKLQITD